MPVLGLHEVLKKFKALDEWITNGGFLPKDWQKKGTSA